MGHKKTSIEYEEDVELLDIKPPMYNVLLHNDDYTPMDFVVNILKVYFNVEDTKARMIMLEVHEKGKSVCGTFTKEIAETKVYQVTQHARKNSYPLKCSMEEL